MTDTTNAAAPIGTNAGKPAPSKGATKKAKAKPGPVASTIAAGVQAPMFAAAPGATLVVPLASILIDKDWNARKTYDERALHELAADLRTRGQMQEVNVLPIPEGSPEWERGMRYRLIAGFRRCLAMGLAGIADVRVHVGTVAGMTGKAIQSAAKLSNLAENVQREDLSTYDLAQQVSALVADGMPIKSIAGALNKSESYFYNLTKAIRKLHPELLAEWQAGNALMSAKRAIDMATLPMDVQQERWAKIQRHSAEVAKLQSEQPDKGGDGEEGEGEGDGSGSAKPTAKLLRLAMERAAAAEIPPAQRELATTILAWVLGEGSAPRAFGRLTVKRGRPRHEEKAGKGKSKKGGKS